MDDYSKTQAQLIAELEALRAEVALLKHQSNALKECDPALQEPLLQQENLLTGFFNAAAQSDVGLFIVDANLRFLQINQALANINGYPVKEHLGKLLVDVVPNLAPIVVPLLQSLIQTGQPVTNFEVSGCVSSQPGALRHWLTSYFPLTNTMGDVVAVGGTVVEITDYKQTTEALRQSEANLRMAQQIAHVGSWHWDKGTQTVFWSEELYRIHGCDPTQPPPQGTDLQPYIHPDDVAMYHALVERARAGYSFEVDMRIVRPDGEIRYVESRGEPGVFDEQGELLHLFGTVLDVTERKRAEDALRKSELALREAQRLAHVGSWQWMRETGAVWSEEIYRIHGLDPGVPNPPSHEEARKNIHPDDLDIHDAIYAATIAGQPYEYDLRIVRSDGEIRYIEARGLPGVRNEQGQIIELFGTVMDVTERKRVEAQLRASEANLARAQKIAHIASWEYDLTTQICTWSEELYRIHQLDPSHPPPVGEAMDRLIHPDDLWIDREQIKAPLLAGQPYEADLRIIRASGEIRYIETRGEPVLNSQGQIVSWAGTVIDITDRKRAEVRLQESNRRWQSLLDQVQLMVVGLNNQGYVDYVNPFFLEVTGYHEFEVLDQDWFTTFVAPGDQSVARQHFTDLLEQYLPYSHYQTRILSRTGEERCVVWNNTVLQSAMGQIIGTISIGEDITEQQTLERLKTEFISVVSHELRTPLTSMQVALSLLDEQLVDPTSEDGQGMIHVANQGVDRLVRLVNDILDLERLESGKIRIKKQPCNPAELIYMAIDQMKDLANKSRITFETTVVTSSVYADPDRLVQVLTNLLSNAIRFSPATSSIEIHVGAIPPGSSSPQSFQFTVKDQGRGIPADQLERVFERFQQVDTSDSREKSGTGLGLAICRSIIHQHGGEIWAESTLGQGSTFYFTIPILDTVHDGNEAYIID